MEKRSGTSCSSGSTMKNKSLISAVALLLSTVIAEPSGAGGMKLPPVTPDFCAKTFCVHARSHQALKKFLAVSDNPLEAAAPVDTITLVFQDRTVVAFAAKPSNAACEAHAGRKWVNEGKGRSTTLLCLSAPKNRTTVVAVVIQSGSPYVREGYQTESEICAWSVSLDRVEHDGRSALPLGAEKCVGDRLGWANPAIEKKP